MIKSNYYLLYSKIIVKSCGCYGTEWTIQFNKATKTGFINQYRQSNDIYYIKIIKNGKEYETIVNKEMLTYLKNKNRKVSIDNRGYAFITKEDTNGKQMFLHNLVVFGENYYNENFNILVDHINNNILDNRKLNLRPANDFQNTQNAKRRKDNTCGIKGFTIRTPPDRPTAHILVRVQAYKIRYKKSFILSPEGLKQAIMWNWDMRKDLHNEFANFGFDIHDKSIEDIIKEQSEMFINSLTEYQKRIFYNNGYMYTSRKQKHRKII